MIAEPTPRAHAAQTREEPDRRRLGLLALGHAVTDSYGASFLAPLFPLLAVQLGLSKAMVGGLVMVMGLSGSLGQPLLGYLSDRYSRLCLVALGPAVAAIGCGMVGHMPDYGWLLACLFVTGLGIGAFHPQGAALAKQASGGGSLAMSAFTVGGNIGFGLAPLMGALALRTLGLDHLHWIALPGLLLAAGMAWVFGRPGVQGRVGVGVGVRVRGLVPTPTPTRKADHEHEHEPNTEHRTPNTEAAERLNASPRRPLAYLTASVAVRAAVQIGMMTFLPFYLVASRLPGVGQEAAKGIAVSVFLLANAFAGPLGGHLSDRLGRKKVMLWSFLLSVPPLALAFQLPAWIPAPDGWIIGLAALALGSFILAMPHPSNVIMAQELMPDRAGIAASLITGLAWGLALLLALPLGAIADRYGVGPVLQGLALLPLIGVPLVLPIPEPRRQ